MLGRKTYTQEGLDHAKAAVAQQLAAYRKLVKAIDGDDIGPEGHVRPRSLRTALG